MALKVEITDGNGGDRAEIIRDKDVVHPHPAGVMVYTHPYETPSNRPLIARNNIYGTNMAVNGSAGGTPDGIHDGTDSILWTASNLSGNSFIFDSTAQAAAGTKSIDATGTANNDAALFARSSPLTYSGYASISGSIYVSSWSAQGTKQVTLKFRLGGSDVGVTANIADFIDVTNTGVWQSFNIALSNFGLTGTQVDEIVITTVDIGAGPPPNYYLDSLQMEDAGGGGPIKFTLEPPTGQTVVVTGITIVLVDNFAMTSEIDLSYDKFGGITRLTNGILVQRIQQEQIGFTSSFQDNLDLLERTNSTLQAIISDGVNSVVRYHSEFSGPVELNSFTRDRYEFTVQDDLSGLIQLQIRANAYTITDAD